MLDPTRAFLDQPLLAYLSTIDAAGYPHPVPVWFAVDGDDLIFPTAAARARLRHIRANPKGAVAMGGNLAEGEGEGEGYLITGDLRITDDDPALRHGLIRRYLSGAEAEQFIAMVDREPYVLVRLRPSKVTRVR